MAITFPTPEAGKPYSYPLPHPHPDAKPHPARPPLTSDQQAKLDKLTSIFNADDFALPNTLDELKLIWRIRAGPAKGLSSFWAGKAPTLDQMPAVHPLTDNEKCYWSTEAFQRVLRAVRWNEEAAIKRAEETAVWRRDFDADLPAERVSREGETGKELIFGYDNDCRPVLYMHPYRQNTETTDDQLRFVVWCLERTIDLAPATEVPTEMLCLCIDFGANRNEKRPPTSIGQAKKVLSILQTYYCERLGRALCANVPGYFSSFYSLLSPFIDPITREKVKFLNGGDATAFIPPSQLQSMFDGEVDFQYDHQTYFPALDKLCAERRAANLERWRKYGGGKCGLSEAVIRGAVTPDGGVGDAVREGGREGTAEGAGAEAQEKGVKPEAEGAAVPVVESSEAEQVTTKQPRDQLDGVQNLSIADDKPASAPSTEDTAAKAAVKAESQEATLPTPTPAPAPAPASEAVAQSTPVVQESVAPTATAGEAGTAPAVPALAGLPGLAPPVDTPGGEEESFALAPEASPEAVQKAVEVNV